MEIRITSTPEFKEDFNWFGFEEFTKKVLHRCADKKQYGLVGNIILYDAEPSKRIYFKNENDQEFTIRYFLEDDDEKKMEG